MTIGYPLCGTNADASREGTKAPEPEIPARVSELCHAIGRLEDACSCLQERLHAVRRHAQPEPGGLCEEAPPNTEFGAMLFGLTRRVREIHSRVAEDLEMLEL